MSDNESPIVPKFLNNRWDNEYFQYFRIEEGDVVLDLGATRGDFASMCLEFEDTKCVSVEASNFNSIPLKETLDQWNRALGKERFFAVGRAITGDDTGSFIKIDTDIVGGNRWATENCIAVDERIASSDESLRQDRGYVETISFMDLIKQHNLDHVNFMKMDVEGSEYSIFENEECFDFILNKVDKIAIEFHLQYLREVLGMSRDEAVDVNNEIIDRFVEAGHEISVRPRTKYSYINSDRPTLYTDCMNFWSIRKR
tara:strand:- start:1184 stop:1951 length:768 start_codon:yes stop_codon:yes gene_type:complete